MLIHQKIFSKYLEIGTDLYVLRPDIIKEDKPLHLLYLLHGYNGDYSNWVRYTNIEKYIEGKNILVVMPSGMNMFYTDAVGWYAYYSYLTKELPEIIKETYRLPFKREYTYIAGLSMGGYGALKAALSTDIYKKVASFSAVIDIENWLLSGNSARTQKIHTIFSDVLKEEDDLYALIKKSQKDIEVYISCGTEDGLITQHPPFIKALKAAGIHHVYYEKPGIHNWVFWDQEIKEALAFFEL